MTCMRSYLMAALLWGCGIAALCAIEGAPAVPAKGESGEKLIVHEWGTFSTFSDSEGVYRKFYPDDRDLPRFVHNRHLHIKGGLPDVLVSLETPVLYFYTDREKTVSVHVDFPKGRMTEWYPAASRLTSEGIEWENVKIDAKARAALPRESGNSRYYAARETDAAPLQVSVEKGKSEHERFLFYRGVADREMPLAVRALRGGKFKLKNTGAEAISAFILARVQGDKVRFTLRDQLSPGSEMDVEEPAEESTPDKLGAVLVELLMHEGLYEKEARAMVKTWSSDWFGEEGTRILYLVPARLTEELLPLRITPQPSEVRRVLVGRHDILTPEKEDEIVQLVQKLDSPSKAEAQAAEKTLSQLRRYRWPAQEAARARLKAAKTLQPTTKK
jgi:hypothetical protein